MSEYYNLEEQIANSDIVFTGEGSYDDTSKTGKVPSQVSHVIQFEINCEVIHLCQKHNVPVVVICGRFKVTEDDGKVPVFDLLSMFPVEQCMTETRYCLIKILKANVNKIPVIKDLKI